MRILIVSEDIPQPTMGGLAKHALTLCRVLRKLGHEVDILGNSFYPLESAGDELDFGGRLFRELNGYFIGWKEPQLGMFVPQRRTWVGKRFARIIMKYAPNYDVIHYHGHYPNVAKFIPPEVNFVQTRHDQGGDCLIDSRFHEGKVCTETAPSHCARCRSVNPNPIQQLFSTLAVKRFRTEVSQGFVQHKTIFVSDMLKKNFSRSCGNKQWGVTVHNFVDADNIQRARQQAAETPLQDDVIRIFVAAKLWAAKGVTPFVREFSKRCPPNMQLTVAGDGPELSALRKEFESEFIQFTGWCSSERTLALAASSHAVVVPSVWEEPCATTVLEGLLLGKTTFALATGGTPELAIYAASPEQLRLHDSMESLVEDLVTADLNRAYPPHSDRKGGAEHAARSLLEIYAAPPGQLPVLQEVA